MGVCLATIDTGQNWGAVPHMGGSWVPIQHNVAWAEAYLHTKWHLDPSNHLATIYQRHRQDKGLIAQGELSCKRLPKNLSI